MRQSSICDSFFSSSRPITVRVVSLSDDNIYNIRPPSYHPTYYLFHSLAYMQKHMQAPPRVSEFMLHPTGSQTGAQQIGGVLRQSQASHHSQTGGDVRINIRPHTQQQQSSLQQGTTGNIRADIDACLSAVQVAMERRNKGQQNFISHGGAEDGAILRIDGNMVMDYVSTVYRDYPIRNRYGLYRPQTALKKSLVTHLTTVHQIQRQEPSPIPIIVQQPVVRHERTSSSRASKQFLNVTQQSKVARREVSFSSQKREAMVAVRPQRNTFSLHGSPLVVPSTVRAPTSSIKRSQLMAQMRQDFRYCINCERKLLCINADFHEQYECPNFHLLQAKDFREMGQIVNGKAKRMRGQLRGMLQGLRQDGGRGNSRGQAIALQMMDLMHEYASEEGIEVQSVKDEMREEQRRLKYSLFRESANNLYSQAVQTTHKLHWFQQMAGRLRQEQDKTNESASNKIEEGRALQCVRTFAIPFTARQQSPVGYMHPHLHRLPRAP